MQSTIYSSTYGLLLNGSGSRDGSAGLRGESAREGLGINELVKLLHYMQGRSYNALLLTVRARFWVTGRASDLSMMQKVGKEEELKLTTGSSNHKQQKKI